MTNEVDVGRALLGSWPQQISAWGGEAIAAYVNELAERGLTPDQALDAIRTWPTPDDPTRDFPPSASALAAHGLRDPDAPMFDEMVVAVFGLGGVLRARTNVRKASWRPGERAALDEDAMLERLEREHPLVQGFVLAQGLGRLAGLGLMDPGNEHREVRRRELRLAWDGFIRQQEGREVKRLAADARRRRELARAGVRGGLRRSDPLAAIGNTTQEGER